MRLAGVLATLIVLAGPWVAAAQPAERLAEIRVHGNYATEAADILALSGLAIGAPVDETSLLQAAERLRASGRFEGVDVRRRYLSIADPTAILVVIVVDERPGATADGLLPGPLRRLGLASMWMPILNYADGYGFTYGVRFAFVEPLGPRTRLSVPLTWGGERRAGVELERTFAGGPISRASGSLAVYRRVNPHYEVPDVRREVRGRVEHVVRPWLRVGAGARTARVEFGEGTAQHTAGGVDVAVDTRLDPAFPRNAIHAIVGWERIDFGETSASRVQGDVRGYVNVRASVLALRARFSHAGAPLPPPEQPLLGGGSLRGYPAGFRADDSMAAVSAEVRIPLTSPLRIGRAGVKVFTDAGTTWAAGSALTRQRFDRSMGTGVYAGVAAFMLDVDIAWPENGKPRVHVGMGVPF